MASLGYIESLLAGLPADQKRNLRWAFQHVLQDFRLGRPEADSRAENVQAYYFAGTTHATPNTEFSLEHGLGRAPYLLVPVLSLQDVNAQIVPLTVTRAADSRRIYLSSSVASAPFTVLVEG